MELYGLELTKSKFFSCLCLIIYNSCLVKTKKEIGKSAGGFYFLDKTESQV